jgi:hypothetical protein
MADVDEEAKRQIPDQMVSFQGGVDSGHQSRLLNPDRVVRSVNCTYRSGLLSSRPGFKKWVLRYSDFSIQNVFEQGYFQGAAFFQDNIYYKPSIVVASGGNLYQLQLQSGYANVSQLAGVTRNPYVDRVYFCEADQQMVIQDGINVPISFDGATPKYCTTVPVGTLMAYGHGRLFVKVNSRAIRAGDLIGSNDAAPLSFTETNYLSEGGDFGPPTFVGDISAMVFVPQQDTATGQGPLFLFGPGGATTVNVQADRSTWKTMQGGFEVVSLVNNGALGDLSIAAMNGDLWYRAYDGWRSYRSARAQAGIWAQTALSSEMTHRIRDESKALLPWGSSIVYDNRILMTIMPQKGANGVYHLGMMTLDFHPISSVAITPNAYLNIYMQAYPAWNDMWTGILPYQLLQGAIIGVDKAFALVNENNRIQLYEITIDDPFDNFGSIDQPIESSVETRAFVFQNDREEKRLYGGDLWFSHLKGDIQINAFFRPDEYPNWYPWHQGVLRSKYRQETGEEIGFPFIYYHGTFDPKFQLPTPPEFDDPSTGRKATRGFSFQMRLDITGSWAINRIRMRAMRMIERDKFNQKEGT